MKRQWQPCPFSIDDATALQTAVLDVHHDMYRRHFATELLVNHALPIELRAVRQVEGWALGLLLTPWMLARLLVTNQVPEIVLPDGWSAAERLGADPVVIGPAVRLSLLQTELKAHLNFAPRLGHYLLQPLIQRMQDFACADEVFGAWKEVIARRDRFMAERNADCVLQREISRREFFAALAPRQS
ncbi:MAG: [NiFe]-hydrogenase assembly chaperone HybE [Gammaproteobacteria bacterium]